MKTRKQLKEEWKKKHPNSPWPGKLVKKLKK